MKNFYESKTFWVNFLTLCVAVLPLIFTGLYETFPAVELLQVWLPIVLSIVNIGLRFLTGEPIVSLKAM